MKEIRENIFLKNYIHKLPMLLAGVLAVVMITTCMPQGIAADASGSGASAIRTSSSAAASYAANTAASSILDIIPEYSGDPYVTVYGNEPTFTKAELTTVSFESYSSLDSLGRCSTAVASIGTDLMPTEERDSISSVKPSGWQSVTYDIVDGNYLYNRCHLIGYQLTAENANEKNLITGTRYLNVEGMLPFENMVADFIEETQYHVLYRVTPIYDGDNLVASGVLMEAQSVEDDGEGISFCVYCYNVQPGIDIDYSNGDSSLNEAEAALITAQDTSSGSSSSTSAAVSSTSSSAGSDETLVWIPNSGTKYHSSSSCSNMKNPQQVTLSEAQAAGYTACKKCW